MQYFNIVGWILGRTLACKSPLTVISRASSVTFGVPLVNRDKQEAGKIVVMLKQLFVQAVVLCPGVFYSTS